MNKKAKNVILIILAFLIVIIEMIPILVVISNSFKRDIDIFSSTPFSTNFTLKSYISVLKDRTFLRGIKNSLIVALISSAFSVIVGAMASYGITRYKFKGKKFVAYSFLTSRMIPQISLAVPMYMLFRSLNLLDNVFSLTLAHISFNIPYVIWLLLPFFAAIPKEFEEAAKVDGCGEKKIFWVIFIPLVSPGLVVSFVFSFIMSWNEFLYALILTNIRAKTAPLVVNAYLGQYAPMWGKLSAAGTLMLIPAFVITLTLQKYIIKGLMAGGVKG
ncbi:carbohydrate ABC transporter membrane protein 2 [Thermosipho africanus Ob7]|jgi:multiple sugar transport system permease protein|uniref:carbohydrate ABC transporter permease n=1 Tax=Thermosipho africanus TaxID=2421 RepID=UPI000E0C5025|nr:carbohydrate ABC transporter permease [Thermosipho africanus]RDI90882.1 carbohydrate ABC transporter membrane protein 2 [Thermosipho africanus Ob7]